MKGWLDCLPLRPLVGPGCPPRAPKNCLRPTRGAPLANTCRRRLAHCFSLRTLEGGVPGGPASSRQRPIYPHTEHEGQRARRSRRRQGYELFMPSRRPRCRPGVRAGGLGCSAAPRRVASKNPLTRREHGGARGGRRCQSRERG